MSNRSIIDAIDLNTNEKIYFKGHAKVTYMSNGTTVEDTINGIINKNSSSSMAYPILNYTGEALLPNTYYIYNGSENIDISFADEVEGISNEYIIQFNGGNQVSFPSTLIWIDGFVPTFEENCIYIVSIVNNLAVFGEYKTMI